MFVFTKHNMKLHNVTFFLFSRLLQNIIRFDYLLLYSRSPPKNTQFYFKEKNYSVIRHKSTRLVYVANVPTCGPFLILSPTEALGTPLDGRGYATSLPICGPILILSPALKDRDPDFVSSVYYLD